MTDATPPTAPLAYGRAGRGAYSPYYRHTGRLTARGVGAAVAVGLPAAVVLGYVYAYADLYIPVVYINVALPVAFGAGVGALCGLVLRWGNVRNVPVSLAIIGVLTLVAWYTSWVTWVCGVIDRYADGDRPGMVSVAADPRGLAETVGRINEVGTWSLDSNNSYTSSSARGRTGAAVSPNVAGGFLWFVWAAEALTIFGGAFFIGRKFAGDLPYCETCDRWCYPPQILKRLGIGDPKAVRAAMEAGRYNVLTGLVGQDHLARYWAVAECRCGKCKVFRTVSIDLMVHVVDGRGARETRRRHVVRPLVVSPEQWNEVRQALGYPPLPPEGQTG